MPTTGGDASLLAGALGHCRLGRCLRRALAAMALTVVVASPALADPVRGEATLTKPGDYARLLIKLQTDVPADVRLAGTILIIQFKKPIDVAVEKLGEALPDYVSSARIDPDGTAIRVALARKVTPNVMAAGERLFIDLLPETWTGLPPGLPQDVIKELAARAREAEQQLRQQKAAAEAQKKPPVRVKASRQPTFVRYVFELPEATGVSTILNSDQLTLNFNSTLTFDLADARVIDANNVKSIAQQAKSDATVITFDLIGNVDVHAFREEKTYVVDIGFEPEDKAKAAAQLEAPAMAAAKPAPAAEKPPVPPAKPEVAAPRTAAVVEQKTEAPAAAEKPADTVTPPPAPAAPEPKAETAPPATAAPETKVEAPPPAAPERKAETPPGAAATPRKADATPQGIDGRAPPAEWPPLEVKVPLDHPPAAAAQPAADDKLAPVVQAKRSLGNLHLFIPFASPTAGAVFARNDAIWLVFDGDAPMNFGAVTKEATGLVRDVTSLPADGGRAIRLRLNRPQLVDVTADGNAWILDISDTSQSLPQPLASLRNIAERSRATVSVPMSGASRVVKFTDPETGDAFMAITSALPPRGFIKPQNFVDFSFLATAQGIVVHQNSDDLQIEIAADKVTVGRPGGLTLSAAETSDGRAATAVRPIFDLAAWRLDRGPSFIARQDELTRAAAMSMGDKRVTTHTELARFYVARGFYPEARGVLNALFAEAKPAADDVTALVLHAVANILAGNPEDGLAELNNPVIGAGYDSQLWKAVAYTRLHNWTAAREKFKGVEFAIGALPVELQRIVIADEARAALETRDYSGVANRLSELEVITVPVAMQPQLALLRGRMDEALGKDKDALGEYRLAIDSADRISAAEARVDEIALRHKRKEITPDEELAALETLAMTWRGDTTEVRALQQLSQKYADLGRYRDALLVARSATKLQPNSEPSRQMQDASSALFGDIFLSPKGEDLPPVDALALFYEFSELTPIGRRGDELIRRLADRLVSVDLLDQAGELLQYQIDRRLDGAARAQVASRLAMIYLMNRKPDRAIGVLRSTRIGDLANELRSQRLLIEARAQSDIGRHDLALDIISNLSGREVIRLRSDIYWAARRWRESAEQIELLYGERWRDFQPLTTEEKADIIRAGIGYSLAEDAIGIARLREKYAAKMENGADKTAFDTATKLASSNSSDFIAIAKMAASVDTLDGFIREMKVRFPEVASRQPLPDEIKPDPNPTGSLPQIKGLRPVPKGTL
jgi:tetratricopeptide (TPR) repeat protein